MKTPEKARDGGAKRGYAKPAIKKVPLRPEEAVLGNCKAGNSAGPLQSNCSTPSNCSAQGS